MAKQKSMSYTNTTRPSGEKKSAVKPAASRAVQPAPAAAPVVPVTLPPTRRLVFGAFLFVVVLWAYWPPLVEMVRKWISDPQYSHAYFVPLFSAVLVWLRRKELAECDEPAPLLGLSVVLLGAAVRVFGTVIYMDWLEAISLLPLLTGLVLIRWGWGGLWLTWGPIAFLAFMVPLPYRVETAMSQPLQKLATKSSTFALQLLGFPAFAEGNVIVLHDERIGIIEACNGLGMLILFFALAVGLAMVIDRPLMDRLLIALSAVPIAVVSNTIRITFTSILYDTVGRDYGEMLGHNQGWIMMPLALGMLWVELKLLAWVLPLESEETISPLALVGK